MHSSPTNYIEGRDYYRQNLQYKIDETWEWQSDQYEIQKETFMGSGQYAPILCRINHAIQPVTGLNRGDDYKKLIFFDLSSKQLIGEKYQFQDNYWITTNTDDYQFTQKQVIVRRCNNVIKYIDKNTGEIISEPCVIDYSMKYSTVYFNNFVDIPQGTIIVIVQRNEKTIPININDRFIFNNQVFKVKSFNNFLRQYTEQQDSVGLIQIEMYVDPLAPDDDLELGVCNTNQYKDVYPPKPEPVTPGIIISPESFTILQGRTVQYSCYMYDENGDKLEDAFTFTPTWQNQDYFTFNVIDENNFQVTNNHMLVGHPIVINCVSGDNQKQVEITLGGMY